MQQNEVHTNPPFDLYDELEACKLLLKDKGPTAEARTAALLQSALNDEDEEIIAWCYIILCAINRDWKFDDLKALEFARLAVEYSEDTPDMVTRLKALAEQAICYHYLRKYVEAMTVLQQCLALYDLYGRNEAEFYELMNTVNHLMGSVYNNLGLYGLANEYIEKSFEYAKLLDNPALLRRGRLNLANQSLFRYNYREAIGHYKELLKDFDETQRTDQLAVIYNYMGLAHLRLDELELAEPLLKLAVEIREEIGNEYRTAPSYYTYAMALYKLGKDEQGDFYFKQLKDIMDANPERFSKQVQNDILYEIYAAKGDYKSSFEHFKNLEVAFVEPEVMENIFRTIFNTGKARQDDFRFQAEELKQINRDMQAHARQIEDANKSLKTYAHTTSHDLREPLRMVSTYMTILEAKLKDKLDEDEKKFLRFAVDGSKRMDEMITRILDSAKGKKNIKPVDVGKILEQVKVNLQRLTTDKSAVITLESMPVILADDIQMMQVFQNLITNAIKYNISPQPEIKVWCTISGDMHHIRVADNGVGISDEHKASVFEMFSRVKNDSGEDGTGIGLSTVKKIIDGMNGRIEITDNEPKGTVFNIYLPKAF